MRPEELHRFSGVHLHYEIDTCEQAARLLRSVAADSRLNSILVESYALHLRSLIDFLYREPRRDDVNSIHFVRSEPEWRAKRGAVPAVLLEARTRADKQIVHLTKKRFADGAPEKNWKPGLELAALVAGLSLFLENADPNKLNHSVVAEAIARLGAFVAGKTDTSSGEPISSPSPATTPHSGATDISTTAPTRLYGQGPPR